MTKYSLAGLAVIFILLTRPAAGQDVPLEGAIAVSIDQKDTIWVGQQVTLNLDLKTTGFSFSDTYFNLPEIDHAFVMQTDSTTVKLSETVDGTTWQILRYPLAFFPQKSGQLEIPPIEVRFSSSAGYGQAVSQFEFETDPLSVDIQLPPGASENEIIITTSSFEMQHRWQPQAEIVKAGDAFTLIVSRSATDVSAMLMPPLPTFTTNGLAAYPQAPELDDRSDRGSLIGHRQDSMTWVVEKAGSYRIPGIRFKWWDPSSRELKQQVIPGIGFDATGPGRNASRTGSTTPHPAENSTYWWWLGILLAGLIATISWFRFASYNRTKNGDPEKTAFKRLKAACNSDDASKAYTALHGWLACYEPRENEHTVAVTLEGFARHLHDEKLARVLVDLQQALVSPQAGWRGDTLLRAATATRKHLRAEKTGKTTPELAPLNPNTVG